MDIFLNDEDVMLKETARNFAIKEIQPVINELHEKEQFSAEIHQKMGNLGFVGVPYPVEYGGSGGTWLQFALIHEEISRVDSGVANAIMGNCSVSTLLNTFGTTEQKQKWLPNLLSGKGLGAIALTEPNAGSDANNLRTTAKLENGKWILNGAKTFITNAGTEITELIIVAAVTGIDDRGRKNISTFIVPKETEGLIISPALKKIGWHTSDTRELTFENCVIPEEYLLGELHKGYRQALQAITAGRFLIGSMAVGLAQGSLDYSMTYINERETFGKKLRDYQDVQFKIADMATKIHSARLMVYYAAALCDKNKEFSKAASMAKMQASQVAVEVAKEAVQLHGGYGVMREYDVSRHYQASKIFEIVEGTSEIQKIIISRGLMKEYY
ncbi:acyl-CoA dehydrogenase family protein [Psychrobacillus soli]|uniref:Acyl-CoA dehydrogenase n=1 Tax=Psychrobacillus soli TaxID=1543965 RepID=A0A544TDJ9_9BACI|nr:acyl-CoA dehydrogenase family protein [Psychrobacillus soli]TQR15534.1 acyl-CoA dehydrogenase [Psychrobacillus soli]